LAVHKRGACTGVSVVVTNCPADTATRAGDHRARQTPARPEHPRPVAPAHSRTTAHCVGCRCRLPLSAAVGGRVQSAVAGRRLVRTGGLADWRKLRAQIWGASGKAVQGRSELECKSEQWPRCRSDCKRLVSSGRKSWANSNTGRTRLLSEWAYCEFLEKA
jgi:hypothetical protein